MTTTIWLALACVPAAPAGVVAAGEGWRRGARVLWTVGALAFAVHAVASYAVVYGWSHAVALAETARQSREATGFDSGSGLYLNFLFGAVWSLDAVWWWLGPESHRRRPSALVLALHGFMLFMIVNGAVVFVAGARRWLGAAIVVASVLSVLRWWSRRAASGSAPGTT